MNDQKIILSNKNKFENNKITASQLILSQVEQFFELLGESQKKKEERKKIFKEKCKDIFMEICSNVEEEVETEDEKANKMMHEKMEKLYQVLEKIRSTEQEIDFFKTKLTSFAETLNK